MHSSECAALAPDVALGSRLVQVGAGDCLAHDPEHASKPVKGFGHASTLSIDVGQLTHPHLVAEQECLMRLKLRPLCCREGNRATSWPSSSDR